MVTEDSNHQKYFRLDTCPILRYSAHGQKALGHGCIKMSERIQVLIVDDEEIFVQSLARVLRSKGMGVRGVYNGLSAVEAVSSNEFDVIILDMRMPGMDGLATLKAIREKDSLTPVILLTGHEDIEQLRMALKNRIVEFLLKPCDIDYLVAAIENASERKAITRECKPPQIG